MVQIFGTWRTVSRRTDTEVRSALAAEFGGQQSLGGWTFLCYPVRHLPNRWEESATLRGVLEKSVVRLRREFPPLTHETHVREWGICNKHFNDAFGLTYSGFFMCIRSFIENNHPFKHLWRQIGSEPIPDIGPGQWIDFKLNMALVIEFFIFLARMAENFEIGEELVYEVTSGPLAGRRLASSEGNINLDPTEPCKAGTFSRRKVVTVETIRASWEEPCVKTLHDFFELFPGPVITKDTLSSWVEKFKERKF